MDDQNLSPETRMLSYGYHPSNYMGSVKCPLFQTSTFSFSSAEEGKAFFELAYGLREEQPGEKQAFRFLNQLKLFKIAVSLGSTESLAEHPATMTHVDVSPDDRQSIGINDQLLRLSIGLENPDDLIEDIREALSKT